MRAPPLQNLPQSLRALLERPDPQRRLGPFQLVAPLGHGGFAPVWLAKEVYGATELRTAAVKLFSLNAPEAGAAAPSSTYRVRVIEEARALCQVEHPCIVRFYALPTDEARGVMGLAMEYAAGTPLDRKLSETRRLSVAETLTIGTMIASALAAVHRAGLVHRDVKPANVVEAGGVYKLIDFGIASADLLEETGATAGENVVLYDDLPIEMGPSQRSLLEGVAAQSADARSSPSAVLRGRAGTLGYIDPECVASGLPAAPASDLYALGSMLFECLTGKLPAAAGPSGAGLDEQVLCGRRAATSLLEVAPETPPPLGRLVDALLAPKRGDRPPSAEWVAVELERLRGAHAGLVRALPPEEIGPFRGLGRFEESDRDVYFGRAGEVAAAIDLLRGRGAVALIGPSGSGKSSLARAGVLPRVTEGALGGWPKTWDSVIVSPGADARGAIASALSSIEPPVAGAGAMRPEGLVEALVKRAEATERGLVLLVDQLEELVTLGSGEGRDWAVELLSRLAEQVLPGVRVIETVRRDLLDPLLGLGKLGKALVRGSLLVSPMSDSAWGDVIDQALSIYRYTLEDEALRKELLAQLEGTAGAMPLVQFALTELWHKRDRGKKQITRASLEGIGGIMGALERHADATLVRLELRHAGAEKVASGLLLALTTPQGTRASRGMGDLEREGGALGREVLAALEEARIVVREAERVTLAHEALVAQWGRLRGWVAEAREDRVLVEEVERDAERWRADPEAVPLWQRRRLAFGEELQRRGKIELSAGALAFLRASRRAARRGTLAVAGMVVALILSTLGGGAVYVRSVQAQEETTRQALATEQAALKKEQVAQRIATEQAVVSQRASRMASARELMALGHPGQASIVLATVEDPEKARGWTQFAMDILEQGIPTTLRHESEVYSAAWSPDGKRILTVSEIKIARVWNADGSGDPLILKGHEGDIYSSAWSPDGKRIVTASVDKTARIWNTDGSSISLILKGHEAKINSAAWSPDGKRIVTASADKTARIWNADGSGEPLVLKGHEGQVRSAAWSPDGKRVVTASYDKSARVWTTDGSSNQIILNGHRDLVWSAAWSPDGKHIVTVSADKTARIWNADGSGEPLVLNGLELGVRFAAWSPDSRRIAIASVDKTARVWNADGSGVPLVLKGHENTVFSVAWSPDGKHIVTASVDKTARVWNADGSGVSLILKGHEGTIVSAEWSPDGNRIVTASDDKSARVWNTDGSGATLPLKGHEGAVRSAAWSPDGTRVATASKDKSARVWNADGSGNQILLSGHQDWVWSAAWSPDGRRIVTASKDKTARVWSAGGADDPLILRGYEEWVNSAAWSPDGKYIATASDDRTLRVWHADGSGNALVLVGHEGEVHSAAWSPDNTRIATASADKTARVWNADGSGAPLVLKGHEKAVGSVAWSPDGKRIATASDDKTARVWNADGSGAPLVLEGHEEAVGSAAWSPDGKRIVTASEDKTVRVWNADGSGVPLVLKGHEAKVNSAAWSPDGKRIVTASEDKTVRIWLLTIPALQQALRAATTDCLTFDQRRTYLVETDIDALRAYEACERSHNRTPSPPQP